VKPELGVIGQNLFYSPNLNKKMRTTLFVLLAFSVASFSSYAQTPGFTFGLKAGANYAKSAFKYSDSSSKSGKPGYQAGVFARVGERIYFQPEINFARYTTEYTLAGRKYEPKFRQLNVPLMVGYKVVHTSTMNLRLAIGPDLATI
jgi:hypothetical protein